MAYLPGVLVFFLFLITNIYCTLEINNLAFVILSQDNVYNSVLSEILKNDITRQSKDLTSQGQPKIYLTHKDFPNIEATWTIFPLISVLATKCQKNISWVFVLEDRTKLNLSLLLDVLDKYDSKKELWIGHALYDRDATIIHHFAFFKNPTFFKYPNIASGFAISVPLITKLAKNLNQKTEKPPDFHIDVSHEFALFVWNNGDGHMIHHDELFCTKEASQCVSYPLKFTCGTKLVKNSIYFAVKTCEKFHKDRIEVVKKTWGQYATKIRYFSNVEDSSIPTINLGIPNTEQGHCAKTIAILKYAANEIETQPEVEWVIVADDDTILSVSGLHSLLSCYNSTAKVALGERYRYNGYSHNLHHGYDYITGGGGMVFSRALVKALVDHCHCPTPNTPDDMQLGVCLAHMNVKVTHSPYFHQEFAELECNYYKKDLSRSYNIYLSETAYHSNGAAICLIGNDVDGTSSARPQDYAHGFLDTKDAVSFHKHWMIDPVKVYTLWFKKKDHAFFNDNTVRNVHLDDHIEL